MVVEWHVIWGTFDCTLTTEHACDTSRLRIASDGTCVANQSSSIHSPQLPIFTFLSLHYRGELRVGRPPLRAETDVKWFRAITFVLISAFCNLTARVMSNRNARLKSKCAIIQPVGTINSWVPQSAPEGVWAIILLSCKSLSRTKCFLLISTHKAKE